MSNHKIVKASLSSTLRAKPFAIFLLFISIVTGIAMQLLPPQILKTIIDKNISAHIYSGVWKLSIYYLLAVVISGISDFIRELMIAITGQNMLANIRFNMAKKLSKLPIAYFSNNPIGGIMSHFTSDVDSVGSLFTTGLVGMLADGLKTLGIIISIYFLNSTLALYVLILIPVIYLITKFFKAATLQAQMDARLAIGHINGFIQEIFNGIRTIKIFGMEQHFISDFQKPLNENINAVHRTSTYDSLFPCIMQVLRAFIITLIVIIAAPNGVGAMGLSIGSIVAAIDLISRMLAPIENIAVEFQAIQEAISGLKRISDFEKLPEENRNEKSILQSDLVMGLSLHKSDYKNLPILMSDVSFSYGNEKNVIENISFSIKPGTKTSIVGRTGAGKSTILNLVAGLYQPQVGSIKIGNLDPFNMPFSLRRQIIGIVPQGFSIYDGTVRDAITLFDEDITTEEVVAAAKTVGLHEDIMKLPKEYDTIIGEGEIQLSYGQYQLLSLACALVCNPPILLLDEVTSGLDTITEQKIFRALKQISTNRTILTISHRVSGIIDADEVIIIDNGRIVETGAPNELVGKDGWYAKYSQIEQLGWRM
jgi:ATP-binding cassette subfamily B multidrug efflux pump